MLCAFSKSELYVPCNRAVDLGLTAQDMIAVHDYTETLRTKRKSEIEQESAAEVIKREVRQQESHMRVGVLYSALNDYCFVIVASRSVKPACMHTRQRYTH